MLIIIFGILITVVILLALYILNTIIAGYLLPVYDFRTKRKSTIKKS